MDREKWQRVEEIVDEAISLDKPERNSYIEKACRNDPKLKKQVIELLENMERASSINYMEDPDQFADLRNFFPKSGELPFGESLVGKQIGKYKITYLIGQGGMGIVYKAQDTQLDRTVALKFLPPHLSVSKDAEKRFIREARAAAALDHSNIATIHEIGRTDHGYRFIAMAYYDGHTLKKKIAQGPIPVDQALDYAIQMAEGLAKAHAVNIVHRDIKPANVMVTDEAQVKLLDFGLARAADQTQLTLEETRMGTVTYMSPEQADGNSVDHRTDLWSLGVVLYEMLTGERPFRGARDTAVLHAILHRLPTPIEEYRDDIPPSLKHVIDKCLNKDPEKRYRSARELFGDLKALRSGKDVRPVKSEKVWQKSVTFSRGLGIIGVGAIALIFLGWYFWPDRSLHEDSQPATSPSSSLAVLPFEALGTEETGTFTEGIHGDLLTRLSNISGLRVVSQTSVRQYRDTEKTTPQIAGELGVGWILEGSVQQMGDEVMVNVQLIDPQSDTHAWANQFRQALTAENLFDIQTEITQAIANALETELTPSEQERVAQRPTDNLEAYRLYVLGRGQLKQRTDSTLKRSIDLFRQAIELDSSFALAWAALADARTFLVGYGDAPRESMLPAAFDAAHRAIELDPTLGEARASLARIHFYQMNLPETLRELEHAIELRPSYAVAHEIRSMAKLTQGQQAEALESARNAVELDPLAPENRIAISLVHLCMGEVDEALNQVRRAKGIQPDYGAGTERTILAMAGQAEKAISMMDIEKFPAWVPNYYKAVAGDKTAARNLLNDIQGEPPLATGMAHAALGQHEAAIDSFRQALQQVFEYPQMQPDVLTYWFRYLNPTVLDPIRETTEYQEFLQEVNQTWGLNPDGSMPSE